MNRKLAITLLNNERWLRRCVDVRHLSTREIAAELGVHRSSVREKMKHFGIAPVKRLEPKPPSDS